MENDQQGLPPLLNGQLHMQQFQDYYNQLVAIASGPKDRNSTLPLGINYSFTPQQLMTIANGGGGVNTPQKLDGIPHLQNAPHLREADNITPPYGSPLSSVSTTHSLLPGAAGAGAGSGIFPTLAANSNVPNIPQHQTNGFPHQSHAQGIHGVKQEQAPSNGQHYPNTSSTLVILSQSQDTALHQVFICSLPTTLCNGQKIQIITEGGASVTTVISRLTLDLNRGNATRPPAPEPQEPPPPPRPPIPAPLPTPTPQEPPLRGIVPPAQTTVPLSPGSRSELSSPGGSTASSFKQELSISAYLNSAEHRSEEERQDEISRTVQSVAQEVLSDHFSEGSSRHSKKSRPRSSMDPKLNSTELSDGSNTVDGINLEEIKEFAKAFKMKRLSLGLTQTQVGQALSIREGPAYSQSAICRFEKLDITPKSAQKIKPVLDRWMREVDEQLQSGQLHPSLIGGKPLNPPSRAQQILDSVCQQAVSQMTAAETPETDLLPAPTVPTNLLFPTATVTSTAASTSGVPLVSMPGTSGVNLGVNILTGGVTPGGPIRPVSGAGTEGSTKKRKRRTSFTPQALDALNEYFEKNTHPTGTEMTMVAEHLNYDREVVRVWFCNKRQALKNTIKKLKQQTGEDPGSNGGQKQLSDMPQSQSSGSF